MKKKISMAVALILMFVLVIGCAQKETGSNSKQQTNAGASSAKKTEYPTKPITLIVSYAAGGGTDLGARLLTPYLEKELGVPVVVENKPGGGGWVGWAEMLGAKPDGYTLGYVNAPAVFAGYLNPSAKRKETIDNFELIMNHVIDPGVIAVRADDKRFSNVKDLIEFAKKNELSANANGVGTENHIAALQMNKELGTKLRSVQFSGSAESITSVIGGHVDVLFAKVGEVLEPMKAGQIKILAVMTPERVPQLPDVPTLKESIGSNIEYHSLRGIAGPKGMDPQIVAKLQDAFEKAMKNPEHEKKMSDMGLKVDGTKGEAFKQLLKKEEASMVEVKGLLGW
ncbi:tripartite tricarboxylate transporter substrate binding protein [Paenibacillus hamazuiensis]|uniref:tripartite tricarboxylate transporter substrate binding protein n=1 Tax=Paenibacillus hamazuiensis TaxID=2936508 RepID=UPI00200DC677|nr:tripartite tricarboxylate transporter substrate binding protein [Paenibacillus hamazuiensis]